MTTTNSKGITINTKNLGLVITLAVFFIGSIVDSALMRYRIDQLEQQDVKYPPAIMYTNQANMAEDMKEIKMDVKTLIVVVNDFMKEYGR